MSKSLHPSVVAFKDFLNRHPGLRAEIRKSGHSWQEYYEKWNLLGEDDPFWEKYKETKNSADKEDKVDKKSELFSQLINFTNKIDIEKVQNQVKQLNGTMSTLQELLAQFQTEKKPNEPHQNQPFNWFKD
ncbi:YlbD family protein [Virgibacillus soli]|uniref:YlbD family protein n=1 Tax=Paracerasibacillus soli TaxID=480284 RepID=UPI0035E662F9